MNDDEEFKAEAKKVQEVALDFAEEKLFEAMEELNVTALIFYLKTKGKERGYVERIEQDHKNLERINVVINNPYEPDTDKSE